MFFYPHHSLTLSGRFRSLGTCMLVLPALENRTTVL
jgi:hypothetical protein